MCCLENEKLFFLKQHFKPSGFWLVQYGSSDRIITSSILPRVYIFIPLKLFSPAGKKVTLAYSKSPTQIPANKFLLFKKTQKTLTQNSHSDTQRKSEYNTN